MPQKFTLSRDGLRKWLIEVVNAQQCEQLDIVGLGDGAWLAVDYLLMEPVRVRRLGLLNLPVKHSFAPKRLLPWGKSDWDKNKLGQWLDNNSGLSESNRQLVKPMFGELLAGGWHTERSPNFPASEFQIEISRYRDGLREYDGEVFMGWGANAVGYDEKLAAEFARGREIVLWHEAANFPMWEQPERFITEITEFLES